MDLYGSNLAFGAAQTQICPERRVLPVVGDAQMFPGGVGGLLPVETTRKKGVKTVWAFPVGEDAPEGVAEPETAVFDETPAAPEEAAPETPAAPEEAAPETPAAPEEAAPETPAAPEEAAPETPAAPEESAPEAENPAAPEAPAAVDPALRAAVLDELCRAVDLVNRLLDQAAELARYDFGYVGGVQVGIGERGWGFTRVEVVERDAHGQPSPSPLHLHIETCDEPAADNSFGAVVEYSRDGRPHRVVMTEYGSRGYTCRVLATVNEKTGKLSVQKVERSYGPSRRGELLYKRGKTYDTGHGRRPDRW